MQMGLQEEPPKLSGPEKKELEKRYIEQGVFNEVMTQQEIFNHQLNNPIRSNWQAQRYIPRQYRNDNVPYKGLMNPIPIHRMRDPESGKLYTAEDLEVSCLPHEMIFLLI